MQPLSLMPISRRRRDRRFLLIVITTITTCGWVLSRKATWPQRLKDFSDATVPVTNQIPYPAVQDDPPHGSALPPLYNQYRRYEDNLSKSYLQNQTGEQKYLSFDNHAWGCGWGNVLDEMVFNALLAWESGRSFVWDDYTWNRNGSDYGEFKGKIIPARIPLSVMVSGNFLGLESSGFPSKETRRPISRRIYDHVCPRWKRKNIQRMDVQKHFERQNPGTTDKVEELSGKQVLTSWISYLESPGIRDVKCLQIEKDSPQIFDIWLLGSPRMQNLWGPLIRSPVLTNWAWPPLIHRLFLKNVELFFSNSLTEDVPSSPLADIIPGIFRRSLSFLTYPPAAPRLSKALVETLRSAPSMPRFTKSSGLDELAYFNATDVATVPQKILDVRLPILTLHLRRGDYDEHCAHLARWSSTYLGFNSFPDFAELDAFHVPYVRQANETSPVGRPGAVNSEQERIDAYTRHCFPNIQQIVQRVRDVVYDFEMDLRKRAQEESTGRPWWAWDGVKKEYRIRSPHNAGADTTSTNDIITNSVERSLGETLNPKWTSDRDGYAKRSAPESQALKRTSSAQRSLANEFLRKVYIMSNGDQMWLKDVTAALKEDAARSKVTLGRREDGDWEFEFEWEDVGTSRDLALGWEEKPVSQVLDIYVSQRSEVFVGNGFSSLTANVAMLRLKAGLTSVRTRFW